MARLKPGAKSASGSPPWAAGLKCTAYLQVLSQLHDAVEHPGLQPALTWNAALQVSVYAARLTLSPGKLCIALPLILKSYCVLHGPG